MFINNNTAILLKPITLHKTIFVTYNDWSVEVAFEKGGNSIPQHLVLIINLMLVIKFSWFMFYAKTTQIWSMGI